MNIFQIGIDLELIKLVVSLLASVITAWIIIAQTENKSRLLLSLILVWICFVSYEKWIDFKKGAPKPNVVLSEIDQEYDNADNPKSATFKFIFKNVGNASAQKCIVHQYHYHNNELIKEIHGTYPFDMETGVPGEISFHVGEFSFSKIWNEEITLSAKLIVNYYDLRNNEYRLERKVLYKPHSKKKGLDPGWVDRSYDIKS